MRLVGKLIFATAPSTTLSISSGIQARFEALQGSAESTTLQIMGLVSLAPEMIQEITSHLEPNDIYNFARTCRQCSRCSQQWLYHTITLNVADKKRPAWTLSNTHDNKHFSGYVRYLHIKGDALSIKPSSLPRFSQLVEILPMLLQLNHLRFDESYSQSSSLYGLHVQYPLPTPGMTVLEVNTCVCPKLLSKLLRVIPSLKTFCWAPTDDGDPRVWRVLQDYNRSTLKALKFIWPDDHEIAPLREFQVIESLSLSTALSHQSLREIVPSCIVEMELTLGYLDEFNRLGSLFDGLDLTTFPRLQQILIVTVEPPEDEEEAPLYPTQNGASDRGRDSQLVKEPVEKLTRALLDSGIIQDKNSQLDQAMVEGSRTFGIHLPSMSGPRFIGVSLE